MKVEYGVDYREWGHCILRQDDFPPLIRSQALTEERRADLCFMEEKTIIGEKRRLILV